MGTDTRTCPHCGEPMDTVVENYRYDGCGLENVVLSNVKVRRCRKDAEEVVVIPRVEELHRVLAKAVASKETKLTPPEIRFLRKYLGWSGTTFAEWIGVDRSTVSRWESGDQAMGQQAERLLRVFALAIKPEEQYEAVSRVSNEKGAPTILRVHQESPGGWAAESVA